MISRITLTLILAGVAMAVILSCNVTGETLIMELDCTSESVPAGDYTMVYCFYEGVDNLKLLNCCTTKVIVSETSTMTTLSAYYPFPINEDTLRAYNKALDAFENLFFENQRLRTQLGIMQSDKEIKKE